MLYNNIVNRVAKNVGTAEVVYKNEIMLFVIWELNGMVHGKVKVITLTSGTIITIMFFLR